MPIIKLKDLNLNTRNRVLQVRLCRIWKWKRLSSTDDGTQLQCVMVDKYHGVIHALISEVAFEEGQHKLTIGQLYHFWNYSCIPNQASYIVVPHEVQLLIHKNTQFRMIPEVYPRIPLHWFQFIEFEDLKARLDTDTHLTDVIGFISRINPITDVSLHGKTTAKQIIQIKNIRNETMPVAIWGETVEEFNSVALDTLDSTLVVSFTSTRVRERDEQLILHSTPNTCVFINPMVPDTDELMARFGQNFNPVTLLTATPGLLNIQNYMFTIEATHTKVEIPKGWYYMACDRCDLELEPSDRPYILCCPIHGYQLGVPVYQVQLSLQDPTGTLQAVLMGNTAENFFGISCFELVYQHGYTDPMILPQVIADKLLLTFKWKLDLHNMESFLVHSITATIPADANTNTKTISDMQQQYAPIGQTNAVVCEASTSGTPADIH